MQHECNWCDRRMIVFWIFPLGVTVVCLVQYTNALAGVPLPSGFFRDNLQHWLGEFAGLFMVQFTSNEGMSNDMSVNQRLNSTQGTTSPTLFEKCVGSLTSHRIYDICKTWRDIRFIFLIRGGSRGEGAGNAHHPPPPLRGLLTTGILQNIQICMICIFCSSHYVIA